MGELRRSSELRQVELTDAALHLIATKGIAALSTRSLAAEVGLSSGAIFRHFPSLEALLDAVVTRVESVLAATYPPGSLPPLERLDRFIEARSTAVGKQLGIFRLVHSQQFHLALRKDAAARLAVCVQRTRAFIVECVLAAQRSGEVRTDVPAEVLARIVMGTMQTLALSSSSSSTRQRSSESEIVRRGLITLLAPPSNAPTRSRKKHP